MSFMAAGVAACPVSRARRRAPATRRARDARADAAGSPTRRRGRLDDSGVWTAPPRRALAPCSVPPSSATATQQQLLQGSLWTETIRMPP
eukprot:COSAG03_NODE_11360_length_597_cov_1.560241_1_plen_89_part_01